MPRSLLLMVLAFLLAMPGCSGDDDDASETPADNSPTPSGDDDDATGDDDDATGDDDDATGDDDDDDATGDDDDDATGDDDDATGDDDDDATGDDDDATGDDDDDSTGDDDDDSTGDDDDTPEGTPTGDDDDTGTGEDADGDGVSVEEGDCDDSRPDVYPGATETCNDRDDDCDGEIDATDGQLPADRPTWYLDADQDDHGAPGTGVGACDAPVDYVASSDDCDDADPRTHPGAEERCDDKSNDCDGQIDEDPVDGTLYYVDSDEDGYGDLEHDGEPACTRPPGYSATNTDCDDDDPAVNPGAIEECGDTVDKNCDGSTGSIDGDNDGVEACLDCNDADPRIRPGVTELCNGVDDDCDGKLDDDDPQGAEGTTTYYQDSDRDGYGVSTNTAKLCAPEAPYTTVVAGDCDDTKGSISPAAVETCNGIDDDCDTKTDDADPQGATGKATWYRDQDNDGYGAPASTTTACAKPSGYVSNGLDCNDTSASISPAANETCNLVDDDCDGQIDEGFPTSTWYRDQDGDGQGTSSSTQQACTKPTGYVATGTDCDDTVATTYTGAAELCDGKDNDCDLSIDEGLPANTFYLDSDKDGYGTGATTTLSCGAPTGYSASSGDCNDADPLINPGAAEKCDDLDNDCDLSIDEGTSTSSWYYDNDADGYGNPQASIQDCAKPAGYVADATDCNDSRATVYPGAPATCDGLDNNCDGTVDDFSNNACPTYPTLLITEVALTTDAQEFIEIYNPTKETVSLQGYYLTDLSNVPGGSTTPDNAFIKLVTGTATNTTTAGQADFLVRFPDGAVILPGEALVVALLKLASDGTPQPLSPDIVADYEIAGTSTTIPDMVAAGGSTIYPRSVGLANTREFVLLFYWDGSSSLVKDVDYVRWWDPRESNTQYLDRTGVSISGPSGTATYANDTALASQAYLPPASAGSSLCRKTLTEGAELTSGGNGLTGADETSEDLGTTWQICVDYTPGVP